jgi:hypothetical protein
MNREKYGKRSFYQELSFSSRDWLLQHFDSIRKAKNIDREKKVHLFETYFFQVNLQSN